LVMVKADTVIGWQRKGFRLFWTWKSRHGQHGRPAVAKEIRQLIRRMSRENPLWGGAQDPRRAPETLRNQEKPGTEYSFPNCSTDGRAKTLWAHSSLAATHQPAVTAKRWLRIIANLSPAANR
jgi:hypothetical protein